MSYPISYQNVTSINAQAMTGNILGATLDVKEAITVCAQFTWTGTSPAGVIQIYGSNDNVNFGPIAGTQTFTIASNAGTECINIPTIGAAYIKAVYTFTSGTGTLTAIVNSKS